MDRVELTTQSIFRDIQLTPTDEYSYLVDALVALLSWVSRVLATAMSAGAQPVGYRKRLIKIFTKSER